MRNLYLFFAFILSMSFSSISHAAGIDFFHGTWQEAIEEAQNQGKIIFVDSYTTWCGPCKRMSKNVFPQKSVGDLFNKNFISIKVDMEKPNGREFGAKYPVTAYPTLFFLEPNGKIIKKVVGGKQADQLIALGQDVLSNFDFAAKDREAYENGDRSFKTVLAYIEGMNKSGKSSLKIANDFLQSDHGMTEIEMSTFLFAAATEVDSKIFEKMLARKSKVIGVVGEEAFNKKIMTAASKTVEKAIKFEDKGLMKLACSTVKKYNKSQSKVFDAQAKMKLAVSEKDVSSYLKASKSFTKSLTDSSDKIAFAREAMEDFPKDMKLYKMLETYLEKDMLTPAKKEDAAIYVKILVEMGKKEEAHAYLASVESQFTDQRSKNYLKSLSKFIDQFSKT